MFCHCSNTSFLKNSFRSNAVIMAVKLNSRLEHPSKTYEKWLFALKPQSWPKLLAPAALGQGIGYNCSNSLELKYVLLGLSMTFCNLIMIVSLNDYGDESVDRIKRKMFPHTSSLKTIPDGILSSHSLLFLGCFSMSSMILVACLGSLSLDRVYLPALTLISCIIFFIYTFPPLKLNYRGGGEILETLGVAFLIPYINAYCQSGLIWDPQYALTYAILPICFASALASGVSDIESDRVGGKKTAAMFIRPTYLVKIIALCFIMSPCILFFFVQTDSSYFFYDHVLYTLMILFYTRHILLTAISEDVDSKKTWGNLKYHINTGIICGLLLLTLSQFLNKIS